MTWKESSKKCSLLSSSVLHSPQVSWFLVSPGEWMSCMGSVYSHSLRPYCSSPLERPSSYALSSSSLPPRHCTFLIYLQWPHIVWRGLLQGEWPKHYHSAYHWCALFRIWLGIEWNLNCHLVTSILSFHLLNWTCVWCVYDWWYVHCAFHRKQSQMIDEIFVSFILTYMFFFGFNKFIVSYQ